MIKGERAAFDRENVLYMRRENGALRVVFKDADRVLHFHIDEGEEIERIWEQYINPPLPVGSLPYTQWWTAAPYAWSSPTLLTPTDYPITLSGSCGSAQQSPRSTSPLTAAATASGYSSYLGQQPNGLKSTGMTGGTT